MRILVVGAGAVGGYFGGRLAEAGRDVTFLVRPGRAESIRKDGLQIVSPHGNRTVHPRLILAEDVTTPYGVILLSVKAYGLQAAMDDFAPAVGPGTIILPMLNGMRHLDILSTRFGEAPVVGGACRISTEVDGVGRIVQLTPLHKITYGERRGGLSDRIKTLDEAMQGAGFDARSLDDIVQD